MLKVRPKKGVSRRVRQLVRMVSEDIQRSNGPAIMQAAEDAYLKSLVDGTGYVSVSWDGEKAVVEAIEA